MCGNKYCPYKISITLSYGQVVTDIESNQKGLLFSWLPSLDDHNQSVEYIVIVLVSETLIKSKEENQCSTDGVEFRSTVVNSLLNSPPQT